MSDIDPPPVKRLKLSRKELEDLSKEEIVERWLEQDQYVDHLEARNFEGQKDSLELVSLRESEDKLRQQQLEATRRENLLVMRLAAKEQEMQEYASQIQDLKQAQTPGSAQLRSTLLDPAVNLMFESMKKELNSTKAKLEETQNELSAWKFTPDSNTGKRLMAKCRLLYQENEELGKMISSGRMAKLEGDLALQKNFSEELKKSQTELDEFLLELDEDVEAMQSTVVMLQKQLRESKEQVANLQSEVQRLRADQVRSIESGSALISSPSIYTTTATDEISNNGLVSERTTLMSPAPVLNHIKTNGKLNGPVLANGKESKREDLHTQSTDSIVLESKSCGDSLSFANSNNAHSLVESGRTGDVNGSPCNMDAMEVDEEEGTAATAPLHSSDTPLATEQVSSPDERLTIEEKLQAMEDCDSMESSHTPPLPMTETKIEEIKNKDYSNLTASNGKKDSLGGRAGIGNERRILVNGQDDDTSSVSDDDL